MSYGPAAEQSTLYLDTLINNFGCFCKYPVSVKSTKTGQYIFYNSNLAYREGISIESYRGFNSQDVERIMEWKASAQSPHCGIDDVERYQAQLTEKLKMIGLDDVLTRLRWYSEDSEHDAVS